LQQQNVIKGAQKIVNCLGFTNGKGAMKVSIIEGQHEGTKEKY